MNLQPLGRAWLESAWRNFYEVREIRRGRNKGSLEVVYIVGRGKTKKRIVQTKHVRFHDPLTI